MCIWGAGQLGHFLANMYIRERVFEPRLKLNLRPTSSLLFVEKNLVDIGNLLSYSLCGRTDSFDIAREIYLFQ